MLHMFLSRWIRLASRGHVYHSPTQSLTPSVLLLQTVVVLPHPWNIIDIFTSHAHPRYLLPTAILHPGMTTVSCGPRQARGRAACCVARPSPESMLVKAGKFLAPWHLRTCVFSVSRHVGDSLICRWSAQASHTCRVEHEHSITTTALLHIVFFVCRLRFRLSIAGCTYTYYRC